MITQDVLQSKIELTSRGFTSVGFEKEDEVYERGNLVVRVPTKTEMGQWRVSAVTGDGSESELKRGYSLFALVKQLKSMDESRIILDRTLDYWHRRR